MSNEESMKTKEMISKFTHNVSGNLIDMQSQSDRGIKFIMIYKERSTNIIFLCALHTKRAEEVAYILIIVEFVNSTENPATVKVRVRKNGPIIQDVKNLLNTLMHNNDTINWLNGLQFFWFIKKITLNSGIILCTDPYSVESRE